MCHLFNKASGRGNSQRGNLAGVLGDMSAGLLQASLAQVEEKGKRDGKNKELKQEDIKKLGEKSGKVKKNDHRFKKVVTKQSGTSNNLPNDHNGHYYLGSNYSSVIKMPEEQQERLE